MNRDKRLSIIQRTLNPQRSAVLDDRRPKSEEEFLQPMRGTLSRKIKQDGHAPQGTLDFKGLPHLL